VTGNPLPDPAFGYIDIRGQRGAAEAAEIEREDDVALGAQLAGDSGGRFQFDPVALMIIDGEREQPKALLAGDPAHGHRIETARQEQDGNGRGTGQHRRSG
jgi:hypothetical protein